MIIQRVEQSEWLSNSYLLCDREGGNGVLIDGNGVIEPLLERVDREGITLTHVLLTHEHWDHVVDLREVADRYGVPILASRKTAELVDFRVDEVVADGDETVSGDLTIKWIATPGHSDGHMALLVNESDVITADVIFKGTVGGTVAPGETGFAELKSSIMERLMTLPPETRIHPGHREPSTVGEEWENNPFIRIWRGLDPEGDEPCEVNNFGPATLILWAPDYDGTNKAWIRLPDGEDKITGGSQVLSRG